MTRDTIGRYEIEAEIGRGGMAASLNDQSYEVNFDNFLITQPGQ